MATEFGQLSELRPRLTTAGAVARHDPKMVPPTPAPRPLTWRTGARAAPLAAVAVALLCTASKCAPNQTSAA